MSKQKKDKLTFKYIYKNNKKTEYIYIFFLYIKNYYLHFYIYIIFINNK